VNETDGPTIFISAAEPSADRLGQALIHATCRICPSARFVGVAGPAMARAGCRPIFDMTRHAAMLLGAVGAARRAFRMTRIVNAHLKRYRFDAAVLIDSPALHLPLAEHVRSAGVPVMYYVAPQMWAWGARRIEKLRNRVDKLAVVLPFEEEYFRSRGVDATFVGHPLIDKLANVPVDESAVATLRNGAEHVVALLPGSRKHVVKEVLPGQIETAERIVRAIPDVRFVASAANPQVSSIVRSAVDTCPIPIHIHEGPHTELIKVADLVLVASGTTTIEVAFFRKPMIVMYNASRLFYHVVGRWLVKTPHLSLPNILAGRELVPEFMPFYTSTEPIADQAVELLCSDEMRAEMSQELGRVVAPLNTGNAERKVADMLLDMIEKHGNNRQTH